MKKRSLFSFLLMLIMLCSLSMLAFADWKTDTSGNTYYYRHGQKLTMGAYKIAGSMYFFDKNGVLQKDTATYYKGHAYVSKSDGTLITSLTRYNGNLYVGSSLGFCKKGLRKINKNRYYFDSKTGAAVKNQFKTANGSTYYFTADGTAQKKGFHTVGKNTYYFNLKSAVVKTGLTKIGSDYYLLSKKDGKMLVGSQKYGDYWYYFCNVKGKQYGKLLKNVWKKVGADEYYYGSNGRRQSGWITLDGKKYYLDPAKNGARTYGKKVIGNITYDFGTNGYVSLDAHLSGKPLTLRVNRALCVVTAYDEGVPVKAMTCSSGAYSSPTPCGTFTIQDHLAWWMLNGPSYGQYCSHFLPSYLFHSVPVYGTSRNPYGVSASNYNMLGSPASGGCIRLCVADAKWIYYNAPIGSTVVISDHEPTPLGKPAVKLMTPGTVGADPTDDFHNPAGYDW